MTSSRIVWVLLGKGQQIAMIAMQSLESPGIGAGTKSMGFLADDPASNQKVNTEEQQSRLVVFVDSS
jgi:hypothetical protein